MAVNPTWHLTTVSVVASHYGVQPAQVLGHVRSKRIVLARHVCWYIHRLDGQTLSEIGRAYGVDHSTVVHGCAKITRLRATDTQVNHDVSGLLQSLASGKPVATVYEITIPPGSTVNIHSVELTKI